MGGVFSSNKNERNATPRYKQPPSVNHLNCGTSSTNRTYDANQNGESYRQATSQRHSPEAPHNSGNRFPGAAPVSKEAYHTNYNSSNRSAQPSLAANYNLNTSATSETRPSNAPYRSASTNAPAAASFIPQHDDATYNNIRSAQGLPDLKTNSSTPNATTPGASHQHYSRSPYLSGATTPPSATSVRSDPSRTSYDQTLWTRPVQDIEPRNSATNHHNRYGIPHHPESETKSSSLATPAKPSSNQFTYDENRSTQPLANLNTNTSVSNATGLASHHQLYSGMSSFNSATNAAHSNSSATPYLSNNIYRATYLAQPLADKSYCYTTPATNKPTTSSSEHDEEMIRNKDAYYQATGCDVEKLKMFLFKTYARLMPELEKLKREKVQTTKRDQKKETREEVNSANSGSPGSKIGDKAKSSYGSGNDRKPKSASSGGDDWINGNNVQSSNNSKSASRVKERSANRGRTESDNCDKAKLSSNLEVDTRDQIEPDTREKREPRSQGSDKITKRGKPKPKNRNKNKPVACKGGASKNPEIGSNNDEDVENNNIDPDEEDRLVEEAANQDREAAASQQMDIVVQFFTVVDKDKEELLAAVRPQTNAADILKTLYGGGPRQDIQVASTRIEVLYEGRKMTLSEEQSRAVYMSLANEPLMVMQAAFGSGKTFTLTLAHGFQASSNSQWNLVLASTNHAITNAVNSAAKFDDFKHLKILRLISEDNYKAHPEYRTEFDLPFLMRKYFMDDAIRSQLSYNEIGMVDAYLSSLGKSNPKSEDGIPEPRPWSFWKVRGIFLRMYQPRRVFTTIATAIGMFSRSLKGYKAGSVFVDEASQMGEATFFAVLATFPNAKFCLVGDERQLPPFCPTDGSELLKNVAVGNLFERIVKKHLFPVVKLYGVYRSHPQIVQPVSKIIYNGELLARAKENDRSSAINRIQMPNRDCPWALLDCGGRQRQAGTSKCNPQEAQFVVRLVTMLIEKKKFEAKEIGVLSLYTPQVRALASLLKKSEVTKNVFAGTIDSSQGKEWTITIVSTVRTARQNNEIFLGDAKRTNVALTRAKDGCIVIGSKKVLSSVPTWKEFMAYFKTLDCCEIGSIFIKRQY